MENAVAAIAATNSSSLVCFCDCGLENDTLNNAKVIFC
jgi:hypothetical protein